MKKLTSIAITVFVLITALALVLTGCSSNTPATDAGSNDTTTTDTTNDTAADSTTDEPDASADAEVPEVEKPTEVVINDIYGAVTVPVNPQRVVALDNRTFWTLSDWGIELAGAPVPLLPEGIPYKEDGVVPFDVGTHNDPNLEMIAAADPDLVIVGQRFAGRYDEIKALVPNAAVINLNFDVSVEAESSGDNLVNGFKDFTLALGAIFDKNAEAAQLVADFDASIANAKAAYNGTDSIMTLIVSGGNIRFAAPGSGRVWGPLYEIFDWQSSLYLDGASSDHQGDDISVEAIAQSNPDWIFVLDRDAMNSTAEGYVPAYDIIAAAPALGNITAVTENQMVFAPNDAYTNESIQTFTILFNDLAAVLAG